jgi:hypothetical protein
MEKLDALGRATFHHIASHEAVRPTNRELRWLSHIERHGPQSSVALLDQTSDTHRCRDTGLRSLQRLRAGGFLSLPPQQRAVERAEFHPYVYDVTPKAKTWLADKGCFEDAVRPTGHWWHAYTVSSLTAAIDRAAVTRSMRYISARHILSIRQAPLGIPYAGGTIIPDQIFALDYGGSFRAFMLEVDRGTEPMSSKSARESLARKIAGYRQIVGRDLHRQHYGLKSPLAGIFTFVSQTRARHFIELITADHPGLADATLVQVLAPDDPMMLRATETVTAPWSRVSGGTMEILKA